MQSITSSFRITLSVYYQNNPIFLECFWRRACLLPYLWACHGEPTQKKKGPFSRVPGAAQHEKQAWKLSNPPHPFPTCSMVLEYLPTFGPPKIAQFNVGKYSSTILCIWVWISNNFNSTVWVRVQTWSVPYALWLVCRMPYLASSLGNYGSAISNVPLEDVVAKVLLDPSHLTY